MGKGELIMKDINNVKIIGDHIIELDVDKAMVVTDDEIPCASYPVVCSDEELIKRVISKIGYRTISKSGYWVISKIGYLL